MYIMLFLEVVFFSGLDFIYIKRKELNFAEKKLQLRSIVPRGAKQIFCFFMIPLSLSVIVVMYIFFYEINSLLTLKRVCILSLLWAAAVSDFRELRIPNKLILTGLIIRLVLLILELFYMPDTICATVLNEVYAIIGAVIVSLICMFLSKGSLGMGDLKLMAVMAAFLGVEGICYTIFVSIFFSFIAAVGLLILRKKTRKDVIPFAPFVLAGTFVGLFLTGI